VNHILSKLDNDVLTPGMIQDLHESIKKLNELMTNANGAAVRADSVLVRLDSILAKAQKGDGPIPRLLSDKAVADDLVAFIHNLKKNGVLFYSDDSEEVGNALRKNEKRLEKEVSKQRGTR
jgi:hypothetical protein